MTQAIQITSNGAVETVTLNRPEALNAMDEAMIMGLQDYLRSLHDRHDVRVVILRAEGRAFCAGLDLKGWTPRADEGAVHAGWRTQRAIATVMQLMRSCPQPIIACAQGAACGGGMSLLLASDVRYCTPDFRMNAAYIRIGLGGCDMGSSYFLPRLVGSSLASEMILSGRFVGAERALAAGFVSEIADMDSIGSRAEALAADMLLASPMGLRLSKDALNRNIDAPGFEAALALEDRQQILLSMTEDYAEARRAFMEKRPPAFRDR
ncbi:enoyl-CoA hydratase/isomerase family protein [Blastomonas sp. AAP53]|uniref:enoyl-CoA hydratase/isomerase family protein n=1 Tax=Blastomonas sp. AAP53 TaxID=1248760 RepID=UPI0002DF92BA|nr:enoyl-CoA hydratase/isomerase family protein [Blastomonas sp. AAP53]